MESWFTTWTLEPGVLLGLLVAGSAYTLGVGPLRRRFAGARPVPSGQVFAFWLGLLVLFLTTQSPLHDLSERYLFSAHMVQHLLLTLVAAPLLLLGTPDWLIRPVLAVPGAARAGRFLTSALVGYALYNAVFGLSHLPLVYELPLEQHDLHVLEHLVYLGAALLAWWPVCGSLPEWPRLPYPGQMLYVFAQTFPAFLLGALLTFAAEPLYPFYAAAPRVAGLSPLEDQRLGGLIMWIGGSLFHLLVLTVIFFKWAGREEAAAAEPTGRHVVPRPNEPGLAPGAR